MFTETSRLLSEKVNYYTNQQRRVFATSSFQTQSVPLLHLISKECPKVPIVFIDTGFLFPETYTFKKHLANLLKLEIIELSSSTPKHQQKNKQGLFYYSSNTDYCCHLNKVLPLNDWMNEGDVWISGVRRDQSSVREEMDIVDKQDGIIRFRPMLDWTAKDMYSHIKKYNLPEHPLEHEGYSSIGCVPCTSSCGNFSNREGRWKGQQKTECGLHTDI